MGAEMLEAMKKQGILESEMDDANGTSRKSRRPLAEETASIVPSMDAQAAALLRTVTTFLLEGVPASFSSRPAWPKIWWALHAGC
jgi:hypothetical protein